MPNLGYETIGEQTTYVYRDGIGSFICWCRFQATEAGEAQSITCALASSLVLTEWRIKCALYRNGAFQQETEERILSFGIEPRWETFNLLTPLPTFNAGDFVELAVWGTYTNYEASLYLHQDLVEEYLSANQQKDYDTGWPDTWPGADYATIRSIYTTYTPIVVIKKKHLGDGLTFAKY